MVLFEFTNDIIPHDDKSIRVSQYFANFFVNETRKNNHSFANLDEERSWLIYNFQPNYTGLHIDTSEQIYFF